MLENVRSQNGHKKCAKRDPSRSKDDETRAYDPLRAWAGREDAARLIFAVLNSRPVVASDPDLPKWFVPSASRAGEFHIVDIEHRVCDCAG